MDHSLQLIEATINDYPIIQNMARFYVYDMSRYCGHLPGWECPENGLFEAFDFKKYFDDPDRYPFLLRIGEELAGFVLVNKIGSTPDVNWNIGEFFILAKFQGSGLSQNAAIKVFKNFPGIWEVSVIPENNRALQFWRKTIQAFTQKSLNEEEKNIPLLNSPEHQPRIIIQFESTIK